MDTAELNQLAEVIAEKLAIKITTISESPWLDTRKAADYLGVSTQFLEGARHYENGRGPAYHRVGRLIRYHRDDLDKWLAEGRIRGDGR